ncbi:unnamed protein product [Lampetra planeri]
MLYLLSSVDDPLGHIPGVDLFPATPLHCPVSLAAYPSPGEDEADDKECRVSISQSALSIHSAPPTLQSGKSLQQDQCDPSFFKRTLDLLLQTHCGLSGRARWR